MEYRDYVILLDENGQPYIAHGVWDSFKSGAQKVAQGVKSAGSAAHKYLLKVGEGAKAQYAYTQQEVDRLLGRGRQKATEAVVTVKNTIGNIPGNRVKDAEKKYVDILNSQKSANQKFAKAKIDAAATKYTRDSSAHAQATYDKAMTDIRENDNRDYIKELDDLKKAGEEYWQEKQDYSGTPLSKVKEFIKDPVGNISDQIKHYAAQKALTKARNNMNDAKEDVKNKEKLRDKYKKQFDEMGDSFVEQLGLALGFGAGRRDRVYKMFVNANIEAADARVIADQAIRDYDAAVKECREAYYKVSNADEIAAHDQYMREAEALLRKLKADADRGIKPSASQVNEIKELYEKAIGH